MLSKPFQPSYFGKYHLVEKIAAGGMAEIFRAVLKGAAGFEKTVALKRILPFFGDDPAFVTLFQDEARIVSTLNHVNIAQVFEFGEVDGSYYLTMELVDGSDLAKLGERLAEAGQPMPLATAAFVVAEAARGLSYAHEKRGPDGQTLGIVHRDVSPQNILISYEGEVKVTDFGIAKAAGKAHKTATGVVMGKLKYMSPEQVSGKALDPRSDVFSLGVILYELVTGGPVFPGEETVRLAELIHTADIPAPSVRTAGIPPELDAIALKALRRGRDERYPRAAELARDLSVFVNQHSPGFTREDLAAMVKHLAARPPSGEASPAAALAPTEVTPPSSRPSSSPTAAMTPRSRSGASDLIEVPPTRAASSGPRQLDLPTRTRLPDDDPRVTTERDPPPPRRKPLSREGWIGVVLAGVILACGALVVLRFVVSPDAAESPSDAPLAVARQDAGPVVQTPLPDASPGVLTEERRKALLGELGRINAIKQPGRREFQVFLSGLDWELARLVEGADGLWTSGKEPPPAALAQDLARHADVRKAVALTSEYFRGTKGELPGLVSMAVKPYLQRKAWSDGEGWSGAALAVVLNGAESDTLTTLAQANRALDRWCAPLAAPARHRDPTLCEPAALAAALRQAGAGGLADALERWSQAQPKDATIKLGGGTVRVRSQSRDPFIVYLDASIAVTGTLLVEDKVLPLRREELGDAGPGETRLTADAPADAFLPVLELKAGGDTARIRL